MSTTNDTKATVIPQPRDADGRYDFDGNMQRLCTCGCTLGVHGASAPHECLAYSMPSEPIYKKDCRCPKFRQSRKTAKAVNS